MKYLFISLDNYIGIYNGMGLTHIEIDFRNCIHNIVIIRGDNGSGKSTLMNAISVFPDTNDRFIPGKPAKKEILIQDGNIVYRIQFIHGVKSNGQRETTKAYISKIIGESETELNENGNVSSYKDILMDEFGLDPSFESLSHISTDDRGIADKTPVERKRFVSATLSNLDVYNDIYKSISKQCQQYKNLINSIVAKLGTIGDSAVVASNLDAIESKINNLQDQKDRAVQSLATAKANIDLLDPDGSIQDIINKIEEDNKRLTAQMQTISNSIIQSRLSAGIDLNTDISKLIEEIKTSINNLNISNQLLRGKIEVFLRERESESNELNKKVQRLRSLEQEWTYEAICDEIANKETEMQEILKEISATGIQNASQFSKETYIAALETISRISETVSAIKDCCSEFILDSILSEYISTGNISGVVDVQELKSESLNLEAEIGYLDREIACQQGLLYKMGPLALKPEKCHFDNCPFIVEAISIAKQDPEGTIAKLSREIESAKSTLADIRVELERGNERNSVILQLGNLIRDITRNTAVIIKLPGGEIFQDLPKFIDDAFHHDLMKYFDSLYQYIYLANYFDQYKALTDSLRTLYSEKKTYESKQEVLEEIQRSIDTISVKLTELNGQIAPIQGTLANNDKTIIELQNKLTSLQVIADSEREQQAIQEALNNNNQLYKSNQDKIKKLNAAKATGVKCVDTIDALNGELSPLHHERDRLNHQLRMIDEYNKELDQLNTQYKTVDLIRYYSSPKTGIQLVYMELYMGNMIAYANQLLELFFGGRFKIMPFIINESEFRIPCAGDGLMNDDISSMSSAQIAMISMVISFAILYTSSNKYNVLKLDEIDGPLDSTNRMMFNEVLSKAMQMLNVEQTIMISHNFEFDENQADLIVLKTSDSSSYRGNIIWKY